MPELGTCYELRVARTFMSYNTAPQEKMLYHSVLGFGTCHESWDELTMSIKVPQ